MRPALPSPVGLAADGDVHHPHDGLVAVHECDVHGELAVALEELLGAVHGVDQPEVLVLLQRARGSRGGGGEEGGREMFNQTSAALQGTNAHAGDRAAAYLGPLQYPLQSHLADVVRQDAVLLRDDGDVRADELQAMADDLVRHAVCLGQRGVV